MLDALDGNSLSYNFGLTYNFLSSFNIKGEFSSVNRSYDNFRAFWITQNNNLNDTREDKTKNIGLSLTHQHVNWPEFVLKMQKSIKKSNYSDSIGNPIEAYEDESISFSIKVSY